MAASRRFLPLLWAGLIAQPACMVTRDRPSAPAERYTRRETPTQVRSSATPAAGSTEFASLIRGPGERIPVNDPETQVEHRSLTAGSTEPVVASLGADTPPVPEAPLHPPPPPPDPPLVAAIRAHIDGHPEVAVEHLKGLDKPNQELMLQLIPVVVRASQINLSQAGPTELGMLAGPLEAAAGTLSARSPLGLDKAYFCRSVKGFARFDPLPERYPFPPSAGAELYVEVRNVPSEPVPANSGEGDGYVTQLACTLQVRDSSGAVVELTDRNRRPVPALTETKRDFTRSPIRDYFLLFRFPVPSKPGAYAVTIEVRDPATGRAVSRTIPLRVGG